MTSSITALEPLHFSTAALSTREAAAHAANDPITVERLVFPVTLSDGVTYDLVGYLYYQGTCSDRPLQVLVHGLSYTHAYWDIPSFNGHDYSYARSMARGRYAVLALDMLGTGESGRPDGDFLDLAQTAESVRQVLRALRRPGGAHPGPFERIALVGHSNGAIIASAVQSATGDADVLVNTGFAFTPHPIPVAESEIQALLGTPYISLPPALRASVFYDAATADRAVIDHDNARIADTITRGQFLSLLAVSTDPAIAGLGAIRSPVLAQYGGCDALQPASCAASDAALYTSAASVTTQIVPACGHILNGHVGAPVGWALIDRWLRGVLVG